MLLNMASIMVICLLALQAGASATVATLSLVGGFYNFTNTTGIVSHVASVFTTSGPYASINATGIFSPVASVFATGGRYNFTSTTGHISPVDSVSSSGGLYTLTNATGRVPNVAVVTGRAVSPPVQVLKTTLTYLIRGRPKTVVFERTHTEGSVTAAAVKERSIGTVRSSIFTDDIVGLHHSPTLLPTSVPTPGQLYVNSTDLHVQCDGSRCPKMVFYNGQVQWYTNNPEQHHIYEIAPEDIWPVGRTSAAPVMTVSSSPEFNASSTHAEHTFSKWTFPMAAYPWGGHPKRTINTTATAIRWVPGEPFTNTTAAARASASHIQANHTMATVTVTATVTKVVIEASTASATVLTTIFVDEPFPGTLLPPVPTSTLTPIFVTGDFNGDSSDREDTKHGD